MFSALTILDKNDAHDDEAERIVFLSEKNLFSLLICLNSDTKHKS